MMDRSRTLAAARGAVLLAATASVSACSSSSWSRKVVPTREGVYLYREFQVVDGVRQTLGHAHPVELEAPDVAAVLALLKYERKPVVGKKEDAAVFSAEEIERLDEPIAQTLRGLEPDERLRFLVTRNRLTDLFTGIEGVSGVVFRRPDGTLHLAFDAIDQGINIGDSGRPEDVFFPYDPTARPRGSPLVAFPGSRLHRDVENGVLFPRWIEVDVGVVKAALGAAARPPASAPEGAAAPLGPASVPPAGTAVAPPPANDREARYQETRRQLELLRRLREDGALSEEEYKRRVDEALKGL